MPQVIDGPEIELAALMARTKIQKAAPRAVVDLQGLVGRRVKQVIGASARVLQGEPAAQLVADLIATVDAALGNWAAFYSSNQWLWLLRRIPRQVFEGSVSTTLGYDLALATVISARSLTRDCGRLEANQLAYSIQDADAERIWRYCAGIRYLSHLHQTYRWASKGAPIEFSQRYPPKAQAPLPLQEAVQQYDERMARSSSFLAHAGNVSSPGRHRESEIVALLQIDPMWLQIPDLPGLPQLNAEVLARYLPQTADLAPFLSVMLQETTIENPEVFAEVASLCCLLAAFYRLLSEHRMVAGAFQRGYLLWKPERLTAALEQAFEGLPIAFAELATRSGISSTTEWIHHLHSMRGSAWPLVPGPVLRTDGNAALLDFYFASLRLNTLISEFGRTGVAANIRSNFFELSVQAAIDGSAWKPTEAVAALRGKPLRRQGRHITDIDAIGIQGGRLLCVSCKSTLYSPQYDAGEFRTIRNREGMLLAAIADWNKKIETLRADPRGDNFDFSIFTDIIGVVCTPLPVYTGTTPVASVTPPTLPPGCSFYELELWLNGEGGTEASPLTDSLGR